MKLSLPFQRTKVQPPPVPGGLTARYRNLVSGSDGTYAWFAMQPVNVAFTSASERVAVLANHTLRIVERAGDRTHLRCSSQPFNWSEWAEGLHNAGAHRRLPDREGAQSWREELLTVQDHGARKGLQDSAAFIGVRLATRRMSPEQLVAVRENDDLSPQVLAPYRRKYAEVARSVGHDGWRAMPLTDRGMAWLLHASQALGVPVSSLSLDATGGRWRARDLEDVTSPVEVHAEPMGAYATVDAIRDGAPVRRYVTVLTAGPMPEQYRDDTAAVGWAAYAAGLNEHVELSMILDVEPGRNVAARAEHRRGVAENQVEHDVEHKLHPPKAVMDSIEAAMRVVDEVNSRDANLATRCYGQVRIAVAADSPEALSEDVTNVTRAYKADQDLELIHTRAQVELVKEFRPCNGRATNGGHIREMPAYYVATALPNAATGLGDGHGFYFGETVMSSRSPVMIDPSRAAQTDVPGLALVVATSRHGKSTVGLAWARDSARDGRRTIVNDPSGQMARACYLPEFAGEAFHLELSGARRGTLNTYRMVPDPLRQMFATPEEHTTAVAEARAERQDLTLDTLSAFLDPGLAQPATGGIGAIEEAVASVDADYAQNPWRVVEYLEAQQGVALAVGRALRRTAAMKGVVLVFPEENADLSDDLDVSNATLTVITMRGITVPDGPPANRAERMALPLLSLTARYGARAMYADMHPKTIWSDEIGIVGQGRAFAPALIRGSRDAGKSNAMYALASQNPSDLLKLTPELGNLVGLMLAGRLTGEAATSAARIMGLSSPELHASTLATMPKGYWLMRDVMGRVGMVHQDIEWRPEAFRAAANTTPASESSDPARAMFDLDTSTAVLA